jgi:hypothetical protein
MSDEISIVIDTKSIEGYKKFLQCKRLPRYYVKGNSIITDKKSYDYVFSGTSISALQHKKHSIEFDYQEYIVNRALERERFSAYLDCGLGKTIIELLWIHDVINQFGGKGIYWCPLAVMEDIQRECERLYGYRMSNLRHQKWDTPIALLNFESMKQIDMKDVVAVVLDEASILKSGDGAMCEYLIGNSTNVKFRLAASATPSPNDQTEYASQAVFLGICSTQKEFYSKFFVKDGTEWRMKNHAKNAFYDFLKSWACYIQSPSALGFQRGAELPYEPNYIIQESYPQGNYFIDGKFLSDAVDLKTARKLFGLLRADTKESRFINACASIENRQSIVWCSRNIEEEAFAKELKAVRINGQTPIEERIEIVDAFKCGQIKHIVTKPSVMGFGVNIQEAEAHLYSGYIFSFEELYQAVRRSHRYGRKGILDVIIPVSEPERPVWDILQRKLNTFKTDVIELQSRFFN